MDYMRKVFARNLARPSNTPFGRMVLKLMIRRNGYLERCAVDRLNLEPDDMMLEVGFGHGLGLEYASKQIETGKLYGVDVSEGSFSVAEERLYEHIISKKIALYQVSVDSMPFNTGTISKAFHCNSFYFWPNIPAGCAELHRVLKPGGLLLTVQNMERVLQKKQSGTLKRANTDFMAYMQTLENVGFEDVQVEYHTDDLTKMPFQVIRATARKAVP